MTFDLSSFKNLATEALRLLDLGLGAGALKADPEVFSCCKEFMIKAYLFLKLPVLDEIVNGFSIC